MNEEIITKELSEKKSPWQRLQAFIKDAKTILKKDGFKGLIRAYGWRLFAIFFIYYLVRDVTLYIFIPWLIAKQLISN